MAEVEVLWLACGVLPGFRPAERRVEIHVAGAAALLRLEVDARSVRTEEPPCNGKPVPGFLRVLLWAHHGDTVSVVLPLLRGEQGAIVAVPQALVALAGEMAM